MKKITISIEEDGRFNVEQEEVDLYSVPILLRQIANVLEARLIH